jgi:hypothetical protein
MEKFTLTVHISRNIQRGDMRLGDRLQPYSLPYTGTGRVKDMRGVIRLFSDYTSAQIDHKKRTY